MKLEDVKIGMKVKLLGKHGDGSEYANIENWFKNYHYWNSTKKIQEQGYGIVNFIVNDETIKISDKENQYFENCWTFIPSDIEPYEPIDELEKDDKKSVVEIKDLVYDIENGTTIVYFTDGTKKVARTEEGTEFDKEVGLLECLAKKLFGNRDGLLKVIESGKVIKRKKNKPIKEKIDNVKISDENVFNRFLKGDKIAINCETEEEAKELFTILKGRGIKWIDGGELSKYETLWEDYEKNTSYVNIKNGLQFCDIQWYEIHGFEIVKFKDIFQ